EPDIRLLPLAAIPADGRPVNIQHRVPHLPELDHLLRAVGEPDPRVRLVRHIQNPDHGPAGQAGPANLDPLPGEAAPVRRPPERPLDPGRGDLEDIPRAHPASLLEHPLERPADEATILGAHPTAGRAAWTVDPHLENGSVARAGSLKVGELEAKPVHE